jgi:hypothetical protein
VWSRLEAAKLVWEELDSSTSAYWKSRLDDYSEESLMGGCDLADQWKGNKSNFTLGIFTSMCQKPRTHASHKPFTPIESQPASKEIVEFYRNQRKARVGF